MQTKAIIYADSSLNILDGSSVWLSSITQVLSQVVSEVILLSKVDIDLPHLAEPLRKISNVRIIEPKSLDRSARVLNEPLTPVQAAKAMHALIGKENPDLILCRGLEVCFQMSQDPAIASKLWAYVTDLPSHRQKHTLTRQKFEAIAAVAFRLFAQTEEARSYIEYLTVHAIGKTLLLPPMIPDEDIRVSPAEYNAKESVLTLVYTGKFAEEWYTDKMCALPQDMSQRGVDVKVMMIGNKIQRSKKDPDWYTRMKSMLRSSPGVEYLGPMSRKNAMKTLTEADLGLSWRDPKVDLGHELSTKLLEYLAVGVPPILNRTVMHENLLGAEYPFFVDSQHTIHDVISVVSKNPTVIGETRERLRQIVQEYSFSAAVNRFKMYLKTSKPRSAEVSSADKRLKIIVAGHDFKFAGDIFDFLNAQERAEVLVDKWKDLHEHDESKSKELLAGADVIFCEWAAGAAAWYSRNKLPNQKLIVRFHGFEANRKWVNRITRDQVDSFVFVSKFYQDHVREKLKWRDIRSTVISNTVNILDLDRSKLEGSEFHLGLVGVVPMSKRLDRALDLMEDLVEQDERFTLHVRGKLPWEYPWHWSNGLERDAYEACFSRIRTNTKLRENVVFEGFGADIGNWLRKIGWVLSPSTRETFHLAPMEAMASGARALVWQRPGAFEIFGTDRVFSDSEAIADYIRSVVYSPVRLQETGHEARDWSAKYDFSRVASDWNSLFFEANGKRRQEK